MKRSFESLQDNQQQYVHLSQHLSLLACRKTGQAISKIVAELRLHLREKNHHTYFFEMMMFFLKFESSLNGLVLFDAKSDRVEMRSIVSMIETQNQLIGTFFFLCSNFQNSFINSKMLGRNIIRLSSLKAAPKMISYFQQSQC